MKVGQQCVKGKKRQHIYFYATLYFCIETNKEEEQFKDPTFTMESIEWRLKVWHGSNSSCLRAFHLDLSLTSHICTPYICPSGTAKIMFYRVPNEEVVWRGDTVIGLW